MGSRRTGVERRRALGAGLVVLLCLGLSMLAAPAAQALSAPEVFLKELDPSNTPIGDWIPLAGARMHSVNGYEIGVRLQATGTADNRQRILVQMTSVPDGHPDQRNVYPLCFSQSGTAGQIVDIDERVLYEGDGTYSLAVTDSTGPDASTNCSAGPTTTGSFTASAPTSVRFVGHMIILPNRPQPFGGLQIFPTTGAGVTDLICARDPKRAPDGTLTGSLVVTQQGGGAGVNPNRIDAGALFRRPGAWACVGRSAGGGVAPGPWSPPTATANVQEGFYPDTWRLLSTRGPTVRLIGRFTPPESAGGILRVVIRIQGRRSPLRTKVRIGPGGIAKITFRMPSVGDTGMGGAVGKVSFGGTRFAAARGSFFGFGLEALATSGGRMKVEFTPPCPPQRC